MKKLSFLIFLLIAIPFFAQNLQLLNPKPSFRTGQKIKFASPAKGFMINQKELFSTPDLGVTWEKVMDIQNSRNIYFKENIGFIYGDNGYILKTIDYGENWLQVTGLQNKNIFKMKIINDKIFCATNEGIIVSDLNFEQLVNIQFPENNLTDIDFISDNKWVMGTQNGKIFKTENAGVNWSLKESVNYSPSDYYFIYFVNDNLGFANRGHGEFLKTIDGGETWTINSNFSRELYDIQFIDDQNGFACGEGNYIIKTTDGGQSWTASQLTAFGDTDLYGLYFVNSNTGFATGDRGRILKTTNATTTWTEYAPFYDDISKFQIVGDNTIIALVKSNTYMRSDDLGKNWIKMASPAHYAYTNDFFFTSSQTGYSLGGGTSDGSSFFKTTDGGQTWTKYGTTNYNFTGSLHFFDDSHGLLAGENGTFETVDGGINWIKINSTSVKNMQFLDAQNGFATSFGYYSYSKLYKTSNGGKTWNEIFNNFNNPIETYHFADLQTGYISRNSDMQKTTDGGLTWTHLNAPSLIDVISFYSPEIGFVHDDFNHISYRTYNGGNSWIPMENLEELNYVQFKNSNAYFGGNFGRLFTGSIAELSLEVMASSSQDQMLTIYPNPSTGNIYFNSKITFEKIRIFNTNGQLIKQITQPKDNHISLKNNPGIYFIQFISNSGSVTKKIILE